MLSTICSITRHLRTILWIAGHVWAHHCCAAWSEGVIQTDDYSLRYVDKGVFAGLTQVWLLYVIIFVCFVSIYGVTQIGLRIIKDNAKIIKVKVNSFPTVTFNIRK